MWSVVYKTIFDLFDFYSGEIMPFSSEQLEEYLKRDAAVYNEYKALNKKKSMIVDF